MHKGKILLNRENGQYKAGFCVINKDLPALIKDLSILHPEEALYYKGLKFEKRKASYLLGRIAAKNALSELMATKQRVQSVSVQYGVFQFPVVKYIEGQNIQVSISHCDSCGIALAFPEEHPLGVDLEKINKDKIAAIKSMICDEELKLIEANFSPPLIGYTAVWTIKESLSKILRTGLMSDFKILEIDSLEKVGSTIICTFKHFAQYKSISHRTGNYCCSITLPKNTSCNLDYLWKSLADSLSGRKS